MKPEGIEESQRLTGQDFRDFYQRPFYTWDSDQANKDRHKAEYRKELDRLSHITINDCNIWPPENFMDTIEYRKNILVELLKDLN